MDDVRIQEIVDFCTKDKVLKKYIYPHTWVSGCVTDVYPIGIHYNSIEIQLDVGVTEYMLRGTMNRIKNKFAEDKLDLIYWKTDGSCPSTLTIYFSSVRS